MYVLYGSFNCLEVWNLYLTLVYLISQARSCPKMIFCTQNLVYLWNLSVNFLHFTADEISNEIEWNSKRNSSSFDLHSTVFWFYGRRNISVWMHFYPVFLHFEFNLVSSNLLFIWISVHSYFGLGYHVLWDDCAVVLFSSLCWGEWIDKWKVLISIFWQMILLVVRCWHTTSLSFLCVLMLGKKVLW